MYSKQQETASPGDTWKTLALLLALAAIGRIALSEFTGYTSDDAFITYRYASHISAGNGFVYNEGEPPVQGTSTPLYTLILASIGFLLGIPAIPAASKVISVLADALTLFFLWKVLAGVPSLVRYLTTVLMALYPKVLLIGISGMEASTVVMMMTGMVFFLMRRREGLAMVLAALLVLCRFDAILWVLIVVVWFVMTERRMRWRFIIVPCVMIFLWIAVSILLFDSWVPHSVIAKRISWHHLFPMFDPVRVLSGYLPFRGLAGFPDIVRYVAVIVLLVPVIVEVILLFRGRRTFLQVFPIFFVIYNLAFSFGRVVMADWYYLPGYVAYAVSMGMFVERVLKLLSERPEWLEPAIKYGSTALLFVLLTTGAQRWRENPGGLFERQNKQLGVWLKQNATPDSHVILEPIGSVGWESGLPVYDYIGLVSPRVVETRIRYAGSDAWFLQFLQERNPQYIVMRNWELPANRLFHGYGDGIFRDEMDRSWFHENYRQVDWNPRAAEMDSVYLVLYENRSSHLENLAER